MAESSILMWLGNEQSNQGTIAPQTCTVEFSIHVLLNIPPTSANCQSRPLVHPVKGTRYLDTPPKSYRLDMSCINKRGGTYHSAQHVPGKTIQHGDCFTRPHDRILNTHVPRERAVQLRDYCSPDMHGRVLNTPEAETSLTRTECWSRPTTPR
ncbi:hypothetical protein L3X38_032168 [Prunus dulcis]|uniref:Uncharacterized protein n=1 Tax=Prunus dulcis TaxID=3755 RepID=A0AAD4VEM1_PRUDU|nr:hypothetical protein L3X38_032168 [Prunus dulcis]